MNDLKISIRKYQKTDKTLWDEYVLNHSDATPYHLSAWKEAIEEAYGFKSYYLFAKVQNDHKNIIKGVLPLIHHHLPFKKGELISLPFCDCTGPLSDSKSVEIALLDEAYKLSAQKGIQTISIRSALPFAEIDEDETINKNKVRMLLNLPQNSELLMKSFKSKLRSQVKKSLKDGLSAEIGSIDLLDSFYPLFAENMRDLGSPVHSIKWLKSILKTFGNKAHLVLIRLQDKTPAAGGIILCHPNHVSVPWASSLRRFNRWNPNMLLYWTFLEFSSDNGYPVFDFGRSTIGEGTYRFKKQWGAKPSSLHWSCFKYDKQKHSFVFIPPKEDGNSKSRIIAEYAIQKLPISMATIFGSFVRKYISL